MTDDAETPEMKASREATDWLILLQEGPDDADLLRRFSAWLERSPTHKAAWAATRRTVGLIGTTPPAYAERWAPTLTPRAGETLRPRSRPSSRRAGAPGASGHGGRRRRWGIRLTAATAAAFLAVLFIPDLLLEIRADYTTETAETRTLRLDDGSTIVLAPESAVRIAYGADVRRLALLAGEVFFEVAPERDRPFQVVVRDIKTTVLGTAFNVLRDGEGATIALQHGQVRVSNEAAGRPLTETLRAGQVVRVGLAGGIERSSKPPALIAAWRNGQLIAEDQPMAVVVGRLRRYYDGAIVMADAELAERPVTGVYNLADPLEALRAIARAHGARVRQITPWLVVISSS